MIVEGVRYIFEKLDNFATTKDAVSLFLRLWIAKVFYLSSRTKVGPANEDPLISLQKSSDTMRELVGNDAAFAPFQATINDVQGYYVSELVEFAEQFAPDTGLVQKIQAEFAPTSIDHFMAWLSPSENAVLLFQDEYQVPLLSPDFAAQLSVWGETFLPIMLIIGLGARFGAFGLLIMTAVIQLVYPASFPEHLVWAGALTGVLTLGAGKFSVDHLINKANK